MGIIEIIMNKKIRVPVQMLIQLITFIVTF